MSLKTNTGFHIKGNMKALKSSICLQGKYIFFSFIRLLDLRACYKDHQCGLCFRNAYNITTGSNWVIFHHLKCTYHTSIWSTAEVRTVNEWAGIIKVRGIKCSERVTFCNKSLQARGCVWFYLIMCGDLMFTCIYVYVARYIMLSKNKPKIKWV